jgi:hypothetical protein
MIKRILSIIKFFLAVIVVSVVGLAISFLLSGVVDSLIKNELFSLIVLGGFGVGLLLLAIYYYRSLDLRKTGPWIGEVFTKRGLILQVSNFFFSLSLFFFVRTYATMLLLL